MYSGLRFYASCRTLFGGCSAAQSYLTLCDPMDCSTPGFPVLHYLLEFVQIHVHWVSDAVQPSHPLLPPTSPPGFNLSQHQGLFQWVDSGWICAPPALFFLAFIFWQHWIFAVALGLSSWGSSPSLLVAHGLNCPQACVISVSGPEIKPMCPALEGGFLTTALPGKSWICPFLTDCMVVKNVGYAGSVWCPHLHSCLGTSRVLPTITSALSSANDKSK